MNLVEPSAWGLLRATAVAAIALALGWHLAREISLAQGGRRKIAWALLLAPLCTPALLISYAYSRWALAAPPLAKEFGYLIVLALRLAPLAAIAWLFFPPPLSREGNYCHALANTAGPWPRMAFAMRAAGPTLWIAGGVIFLFAFAEFELASLWAVQTWTVALFDGHTGGLALSESLRLAAAPLACQGALLAAVLFGAGTPRIADAQTERPAVTRTSALFVPLGLMVAVTSAYPIARLIGPATAGFAPLLLPAVFWQDFAASVGFAWVAALIAWAVAARQRKWILLSTAPGLLGALVLSLLVLALFQQGPLRAVYDTPLPLILGLIVLLLPLASLLRYLLASRRPIEALHLARLLGNRGLLWELEGQRQLFALCALFGWAYFDFTASSILAPVGVTPVFVRLHNFAHYGQTAALSAMLLAAFLAPLFGVALTVGAARLYARLNAR